MPEEFYKRRSQQKTLHLRPDFCGFPAPLVIEQDLFSLSAPKARDAADNRVAFVGFLPAVFMTRFATKPVTCKTSKQNVGHVPTTLDYLAEEDGRGKLDEVRPDIVTRGWRRYRTAR
jgi:hypothetical protein